ncbi:MAG: HNH endonuclease [Planctomycetes bacterium]|nr:HNH endonuclease [Planctomycetota bacterium]
MSRTKLAAAYNRKFSNRRTAEAIKQICLRKGWHTGRTGRFEKGNVPWAAGTKGKGLCKANKGSFKKGNRPCNSLSVGSEIIDSDGYIKVKLSEPNIWKFKHRIIWEAVHGEIPSGMAVIFKDSNPLNCTLENLEMVSRRELLYLNNHGYTELPEELRPSMMAVAKVECKVFRLANT